MPLSRTVAFIWCTHLRRPTMIPNRFARLAAISSEAAHGAVTTMSADTSRASCKAVS